MAIHYSTLAHRWTQRVFRQLRELVFQSLTYDLRLDGAPEDEVGVDFVIRDNLHLGVANEGGRN